MVKKRSTYTRTSRVTNGRLAEIVNENHLEIVERLTAVETELKGLPAKVERLEAHRNWLTGAIAVLSSVFAYLIHKGH